MNRGRTVLPQLLEFVPFGHFEEGRIGIAAWAVFCGDAAPAGECGWRTAVVTPAACDYREYGGLPVVFPVHPRPAKTLSQLEGQMPDMHYVDPQGYLEFNYLMKHAKGMITDSGGITEETTVAGAPCLTLRDNTKRPETVTVGTNELIGADPGNLGPALARLMAG